MIKVAIIGAESTGKTSLAEVLASHYQTSYVKEYAREYLQQLGRQYTQQDVELIAKGQLINEDQQAKTTKGILICDTNLLVIKIWMDNTYGQTPLWILDELSKRQYDLHILADHDIPYEPDPLREHPEMRPYFTEKYFTELTSRSLRYIKATGSEAARLSQAIAAIDYLLY